MLVCPEGEAEVLEARELPLSPVQCALPKAPGRRHFCLGSTGQGNGSSGGGGGGGSSCCWAPHSGGGTGHGGKKFPRGPSQLSVAQMKVQNAILKSIKKRINRQE